MAATTPLGLVLTARGLTNDELARQAGASPAWIGQLVKGLRRPSDTLAARIGEVLGADPVDLFPPDDDVDVVVSFVRRTTNASGVTEKLEDPALAEAAAAILRDAG